MPQAETVQDLLVHHAKETFVGRDKELALLSRALDQSMPPVSFVHGIGGIGKSRMLEAFTSQPAKPWSYGLTAVSSNPPHLGSSANSEQRSVAIRRPSKKPASG